MGLVYGGIFQILKGLLKAIACEQLCVKEIGSENTVKVDLRKDAQNQEGET